MKISDKMIANILILILFGCNQKSGNIENKSTKEAITVPANRLDSFPVSNKDMSVIYPYALKKYKGQVSDRELTLFIVKGKFEGGLYKGFYFWEDEKKPKYISGLQIIQNSETNIDIINLEGETAHKAKAFDYAVIKLNDIFSSSVASDDKEYGIRGFIKENTFYGYFSYPNFPKGNCYDFGDFYNVDNCINVVLKEDKTEHQSKSQILYLLYKGSDLSKATATNYNIKLISNITLPNDEVLRTSISSNLPHIDTLSSSLDKSVQEWVNNKMKEKEIQFITVGNKRIQITLDFIPAYRDSRFLSYLTTETKTLRAYDITYQGLTFDLSKNSFLTADEIFQSEKQDKIRDILAKCKEYKQILENYDDLIKLADFKISNFILTNSGVEFIFPVKERLSPILIHVPYNDMKNELNPNFLKSIKI